jgi:hypothetical protein
LGSYILYEFLRWHVDFKNAPAILKILHIALVGAFGMVLFVLLFGSWAWKFAPVLLWGERVS